MITRRVQSPRTPPEIGKGWTRGGDGPGSVWNFLVCLAMHMAGQGMSMTGMLSAQGDFYGTYMKCVDKDIAKALKIPLADYMVVLLSKAFTQSGMCMVEVFTAIKSGIQLVLVNVEESIDWTKAWPLKQTLARYPFEGGKLRCCMSFMRCHLSETYCCCALIC